MSDFTTDDIAIAVEIPGVYDGTSAYLLKDGTWRNRWDGLALPRRQQATAAWIEQNGDTFREANRDLLDSARS
ncbi:hypothetical protein SEA_DELIAN_69 [Gordonia phage Delian]|uniref:hypothetical protein n=1 Tax=Gordonia phage Utz TaxID=1838081 RepID=UPI0007B65041|nr:hypothetical protein BH796_gp58 [Gordonia phage Utz]YP_009287283.1 hypothetical protein BIZ76_gp66 [Gordonia phage CaptainKirk2]QDH85387.1 hypothetical protein SEA_MINTFEN_66 [Gordonia phage MintFen]QGH77989.1 hypothetical protein SEA_DELIAN_69 [Gordonia phage Delian]ANA86925.1 hypothetical protein PBI_UTZ_58 [Gordonia phage Utz]AOE44009.1 hypothetical protein SEA_CAPTAINKIRK2_66 [Gordonia phage CaptainKirk2]